MITYRSILEGNPPGLLYWQLDGLNPFRGPRPEDFIQSEGRRIFGTADSGKPAEKPFASRNEPWLSISYENLRFLRRREGVTDVFIWETPLGILTGRRESNHMVEYPVKTVNDIPLWQFVQENLIYGLNPAFSDEDSRQLWLMGFKWSPLQELIQFETGVENFYYFLADAPDRMELLMETMHQKNLEAIRTGFRACKNAAVFSLGENTTSAVLSPAVYRRITLPHVRDYVQMAHARGMKCIVHMCGHLKSLFDCFAETGMDGIHAVTPPPVGDTDYMSVRDYFGDEFVIIGRLNAQLWVGRTTREISGILDAMIPGKLVHTPFALWVSTDETRPAEDDVMNLTKALEEYNEK